jgi:hypothetical protein
MLWYVSTLNKTLFIYLFNIYHEPSPSTTPSHLKYFNYESKCQKHFYVTLQGPVAIILISWNVIFIWETGYWTRAITRFALFDLLKSLYSDNKILSKYIPSLYVSTLNKTLFIYLFNIYHEPSPSTTPSHLKYFNYESKCQKHFYVTHW